MPLLDGIAADPKRSTTAFWLVTALLAVLLVGGVALPVAGAFGDRAEAIRAAQARLDAQARIVARADSIAAELAALEAAGADSGDLLAGGTDPLAGAELQTLLAGAVQAAGGRLVSTQVLPAEPAAPGFRLIRVRGTAALSARQLRDLLHALEGGLPRLLVRELTVRTADATGATMEVNLDVAGFRAEGTP